jgi:PAS domain S-box-containing protein
VLLIVLGVLRLSEFLLGRAVGLDALFAASAGQAPSLAVGRLSVVATITFSVLGLALVAARSRHRGPAFGVAALALGASAIASLLNAALGVPTTTPMALVADTAVHTSLGMLAAAWGLLAIAWPGPDRHALPVWVPLGAGIAVLVLLVLLLEVWLAEGQPRGPRVVFALAAVVSLLIASLVFYAMREAQRSQERLTASEAAAEALERLQAEAATSNRLLTAFVEHAPAAVAMFDRDIRYLAWSRRWLQDYRLGLRDLRGLHHYDVFPEIRDMPEWHAVHQRALAGQVEQREEEPFTRHDGKTEWIRWEVRPWYDSAGSIGGIIMLTEVITERKLASLALEASQARLQLVLDNAQHGLWDWNVQTGVVHADARYSAILGYGEVERTGPVDEIWTTTLHPDSRARVIEHLARALRSDDAMYDVDYRAVRRDGSTVWVNTHGRVYERTESGEPLRMMGTLHDITTRKQDEELVLESLREKEVLLKEIHHRVKNNLAVISSLLYLQSTSTDDPGVVALLEDCRNRVQSMALVHEQLYRSTSLASIDFADYVRQLSTTLLQGLSAGVRIDARYELSPLALSIDKAVPCALVLNEMLTNALKHAFRGREIGRVLIAVRPSAAGHELVVEDDGVGIQDVDVATSRSLGMLLMRTLASQIDATCDVVSTGSGTRATLRFAA